MPDIKIDASSARVALRTLIDQLDQANLSELKPKSGGSANVSQWKQALRKAESEIVEWCPTSTFTFDAPPRGGQS